MDRAKTRIDVDLINFIVNRRQHHRRRRVVVSLLFISLNCFLSVSELKFTPDEKKKVEARPHGLLA